MAQLVFIIHNGYGDHIDFKPAEPPPCIFRKARLPPGQSVGDIRRKFYLPQVPPVRFCSHEWGHQKLKGKVPRDWFLMNVSDGRVASIDELIFELFTLRSLTVIPPLASFRAS